MRVPALNAPAEAVDRKIEKLLSGIRRGAGWKNARDAKDRRYTHACPLRDEWAKAQDDGREKQEYLRAKQELCRGRGDSLVPCGHLVLRSRNMENMTSV